MTNRPTVLIDGVVFENQHQVGIWRIFYEVMSRTSQAVDYKLLLGSQPLQPIPEGTEVVRSHHREHVSNQTQFIKRFRRRLSTEKLRRKFPDAIWHSTYFTPDVRMTGRSVVSVYDMIAEDYFIQYPTLEPQLENKRICLESTDAVLAISEETKSRVVSHFPALTDKVVVALLGSEHLHRTTPSKSAQATKRKPFVLFLGNRGLYKNFRCLTQAVASATWPSELDVVVAGKPFSENEKYYLRVNNLLERFQNVGYVTDNEIAALLQTARCLVFPSLAEGFGLPVVESQINSCPAVLSDLPVFHEVAGEGAVFIDPNNPVSLAAGVRSLNDLDCQLLIDRGLENTLRFNWDQTAALTLQCYQNFYR